MIDEFSSTADVPEEKIIQKLKDNGIEFDKEGAEKQWWKRQASSFMASFRDQKGIRDIFAVKDADGKTVFVHAEKEKQSRPLTKIRQRLDREINGRQATRKKLRRVEDRAVRAEQLLLFAATATNAKKKSE